MMDPLVQRLNNDLTFISQRYSCYLNLVSASVGYIRHVFVYYFRQTIGKHSVHRRYNTKTAGQSSNQGM